MTTEACLWIACAVEFLVIFGLINRILRQAGQAPLAPMSVAESTASRVRRWVTSAKDAAPAKRERRPKGKMKVTP